MSRRRGVSLVEVLVATVLLGVGVGGTLASLAAAARLRAEARVREAMAAAVADRLDWFAVRGCLSTDTAGADLRGRRILVTWAQRDSAPGRRVRVTARDSLARVAPLRLTAERRCD